GSGTIGDYFSVAFANEAGRRTMTRWQPASLPFQFVSLGRGCLRGRQNIVSDTEQREAAKPFATRYNINTPTPQGDLKTRQARHLQLSCHYRAGNLPETPFVGHLGSPHGLKHSLKPLEMGLWGVEAEAGTIGALFVFSLTPPCSLWGLMERTAGVQWSRGKCHDPAVESDWSPLKKPVDHHASPTCHTVTAGNGEGGGRV
ncbi:unnamed protein product, partial [Pleuronectes platessa]